MLIANDISSNAIGKTRLRGVRALPTENNLGFQPYVKVTSTRSTMQARIGKQKLTLVAFYDVSVHFSLFRKKHETKHVEVKMEFNKDFLLGAALRIDTPMRLHSSIMPEQVCYPVEYLCAAMEAVIAARSELLISTDANGNYIGVELVCKLPQDVRKERGLRALPRMGVNIDKEDLRDFFRPKKVRRKKSV